MVFRFTPNAKDERNGTVKDCKAPDFAPGGPDGHPYFEFGFLTKQKEHGVFYVDLTESRSDEIVSLLAAAFVRRQSVHIVFRYPDKPRVPELSPGGIIVTASLN